MPASRFAHQPAPTRGQHEELTLAVGTPAHGGHCLARPVEDPTGHVVFVRHALPGEVVRARMTQKTSKVWRADAVEILSASPDRVPSVWPEAGPGGVGGGELSHVALPAQRTWKRWVLADCLRRIGGPEIIDAVAHLDPARGGHPKGAVSVEPMPAEDPSAHPGADGTGTRTRVSLTVGENGRAGMHAFRSSTVLEVENLVLATPAIQNLGLTGSHAAGPWRDLPVGATLAAVDPSVGEPLVILTPPGRGRRAGKRQVLDATGKVLERRRLRESVDASALGLGHLEYALDVEGFWQIHHQAPQVLVERVVRGAVTGDVTAPGEETSLAEAGRDLRVLELYSGAGLFTLPLARAGATLTTLEGSETAVAAARRNLAGYPATTLAAGRVTARSVAELGGGVDVVILDPPRQGAGRDVTEAICALAPSRVVMVACDPAAAARDLATFLAGGYHLASMTALDMFPHTHHFETLVVLERH